MSGFTQGTTSMLHTVQTCLIALTYKRKILLIRLEDAHNIINTNSWSFISIETSGTQSVEALIRGEVIKNTSISPTSLHLLMEIPGHKKQSLFHAGLTDKEVNEIERVEGQDLQFFTMKELEKLSLSAASSDIFAASKSLIEESFVL